MKINQETCIIGKRTVLVPYRKEHVPKYHGWMVLQSDVLCRYHRWMVLQSDVFCRYHRWMVLQNDVLCRYHRWMVLQSDVLCRYHGWMKNEELQQLTASEPLTLDEEFAMQCSWCEDEQKCTFIILDARKFKNNKENEIESMVGDVNLFFNDIDDKHSAEVEIMIAEKESQGQGFGKEALLSMMDYGVTCLGVKRFTAKIGYTNKRSLQMFHKLSFTEVCRSDIFEEVTLELNITQVVSTWLEKETHHLQTVVYKS
ncbi:N-acetyltransferase 9-like protein [Lamellibrachia satsuma]|nr:N-acetyltransferase 9-like protein [Lamellibrachia satsuma]KAI0234201.1 N-acetyltransferase 9-like protein [Lamellibrachia satsuma]